MPKIFIESFIRGFISLSLFGGLWMIIHTDQLSFSELLILIILVSVLIIFVRNKNSELARKHNKKLVYFLAFSLPLFYIFWATQYSSVQTGDFGVYWRCGTEYIQPIKNWLDICHGAYLLNPLVYAKRAFFFNVPISWLINHDYFLWKLLMALLHIASVYFLYRIVKGVSGHIPGIISAILLFINPEWVYLITSSSADNMIVMVQILSFYIFYQFVDLRNKYDYIIFFPIFIGIFFFSEWIRSISIFLLLTFLLLPSNFGDKKLYLFRASILCFSYIAATYLTSFVIHNLWGISYDSPLGFISRFAEIDLSILPPQNPQVSFEWKDHLWLAIEPSLRNQIGFQRFYDEFLTQYLHFPEYYFRKIALLFYGSGNMDLLQNIIPDNADNVFTAAGNNLPSGVLAHKFALYINIFILLLVLYSVTFVKYSSFQIISLTFIGVFMVVLGGFGPLLSRYGLLMAFPLATLGSTLGNTSAKGDPFFSATFYKVIFSGVLIVSLYAGGALCSLVYKHFFPRIIHSVTQPDPSRMLDDQACNQLRVPMHFYFDRRLRSDFEPNIQCASYIFPLKKNIRSVSFFITREKLPYPNENIGASPFEYQIKIGDKVSNWESLEMSSSKWIHIDKKNSDSANFNSVEIYIRRTTPNLKFDFEIRDFLYY
jgi:hypothetical protein